MTLASPCYCRRDVNAEKVNNICNTTSDSSYSSDCKSKQTLSFPEATPEGGKFPREGWGSRGAGPVELCSCGEPHYQPRDAAGIVCSEVTWKPIAEQNKTRTVYQRVGTSLGINKTINEMNNLSVAVLTFWGFVFLSTGRRIFPFRLNWSEITSTTDKTQSDEWHTFPTKLTAIPINTSQNWIYFFSPYFLMRFCPPCCLDTKLYAVWVCSYGAWVRYLTLIGVLGAS